MILFFVDFIYYIKHVISISNSESWWIIYMYSLDRTENKKVLIDHVNDGDKCY